MNIAFNISNDVWRRLRTDSKLTRSGKKWMLSTSSIQANGIKAKFCSIRDYIAS